MKNIGIIHPNRHEFEQGIVGGGENWKWLYHGRCFFLSE
jgi:hypothetical protein